MCIRDSLRLAERWPRATTMTALDPFDAVCAHIICTSYGLVSDIGLNDGSSRNSFAKRLKRILRRNTTHCRR